MFKLNDLQGAEMRKDVVYRSKKAVVKDLTNFHDQDFKGTDGKDNELSINEYFKFWKLDTTKKQLAYLLDYGCWELVEVNNRNERIINLQNRVLKYIIQVEDLKSQIKSNIFAKNNLHLRIDTLEKIVKENNLWKNYCIACDNKNLK